MSLKDRINRLTGDTPKPVQADPKQERISELRKRIEEVMNRRDHIAPAVVPQPRSSAVPLERVVEGEEVATGHGRFFCSRSTLTGSDFHGHSRVSDLADLSMEAAAFLAGSQALKGFSLEDGLFLDTETTGLAGGTGTFPFLIGLGWFEKGSFVTSQLFARDFSEERSMLAFLSELASTKRFLVTFNGRAYDLNLLSSRYILNRAEDVLLGMPHIDLLHPSRRMFAHRLENARLVTIEAHVLGVRRTDDVPGYEIPQRYFDWLKRRDGRLMEDVFRHNRLDIVSMASLLKHLAGLVEGGHEMPDAHPGDLLCAARLHHDRGDLASARRMLEPLVDSTRPEIALGARRSLSLIHKRSLQWDEAVCLWKDIIAMQPYDVFAAEELAKWYEHHARELGMAMELVQRILDEARHLGVAERQSLEHRMKRLLHKTALK
jgi:uncharacterized protein YprB with RNaseH-like and TPR domain